MTDRESQGCGIAAPFFISNFRKIFSITVALCFTSLTIGGAATLNKSQDNRKKEIVAHTTLTTKKIDPPKVRKRVRKKPKKKLKNIRQAPPLSPNSIPSIALDLQMPTVDSQEDPFASLEEAQDFTEAPIPSPSNPMPHYPLDARREGIQGKVVVRVLVDEYGYSTQYKIIQSDKHFDAEVLKVIGQWRFTPAKNRGMAVEKNVDIPFNFVL